MKISENSLLLRWVYLPRIINRNSLPERINLCPFFWRMVFSPIVNLLFMIFVALRWIWRALNWVLRVLNGEVDWLPRPFEMNFSLIGYSVFMGLMSIEIWFIASVWGGAGWKFNPFDYFGQSLEGEIMIIGFLIFTVFHIIAIGVLIFLPIMALSGTIKKTEVVQVTKEFISAKKRKICPEIEIVS